MSWLDSRVTMMGVLPGGREGLTSGRWDAAGRDADKPTNRAKGEEMFRVYEIADAYVDRLAALHPFIATSIGVPGYDDQITDFSPQGVSARADLSRSTLAELRAAPVEDAHDRIARESMIEALETQLELYEREEYFRDLNALHCPLQSIRSVFDLMPRETEEDWRNIAARMHKVPEALAKYRQTLVDGQARGKTASARQTTKSAGQAEAWSGLKKGMPSFFQSLLEAYDESDGRGGPLRDGLAAGVATAASAYADMRSFLLQQYLPGAVQKDAVGRDRYAIAARAFNGMELDLEEVYLWGWEQLAWIEREMAETAEKIAPGRGLDAARELLATDPKRAIEGVENFRRWMQELQERTIDELDGTHFDIAEPVKKIECLIAPPGGALAMYYTHPSEDFSRPGRVWYPTGDRTRFPLWTEVSVAYHEGVPGHHFQIATTTYLRERLSRFQRLLGGTSGHAEGWGLYAERLMAELGYLENPDYYLGMLISQAFRGARVVIDIGMHLELEIPSDQPFHPGETWTPELGLEFLKPRCPFDEAFAVSEIDRYLGVPGQAISYKVGERVWLESREEARSRQGAAFDLKSWHDRALNLGPMGLGQMKREMAATR